MSEKGKDEEKKVIKGNKNEEIINVFNLEKERYLIYDQDKEKEEINFDSIDFNINPFNNEEINKKEEKNPDKLLLEKKDDTEGHSQNPKYNDIQYRQKYQSNIILQKKENIKQDLMEKKLSSNKDNNVNFNNIQDNRKETSFSNLLFKTIYNDNENNNSIIKSYDNYPNINIDSKAIIPKPVDNINSNYNPFLRNFNNQINYINNNLENNQIKINSNINQMNYINNYGNNQINYINSNNYFPMLIHNNWICSICNNYNSGGKNLFI